MYTLVRNFGNFCLQEEFLHVLIKVLEDVCPNVTQLKSYFKKENQFSQLKTFTINYKDLIIVYLRESLSCIQLYMKTRILVNTTQSPHLTSVLCQVVI
jgi:hypothetical protein